MKKILTLTVNPALDVSTSVDRLVHEKKLRCTEPQHDPGGGGLNVARVIQRLGGDVTALYPVGGAYGEMLRQLLDREGIDHRPLPVSGETRESFTVHVRETGDRLRFVLPGHELSAGEQRRCLDALASLGRNVDYLVASGSLPPGVPDDFFAEVARRARKVEARFVLDTSGPALQAALEEGVYLAKPNATEFAQLTGEEADEPGRQEALARALVAKGAAEVLVVSLGAEGALLTTQKEQERMKPPEVEIRSAVGAGDCFVGGMTYGLSRGWTVPHAFRFGLATSAAALITPGTELCRREDAVRLCAQLSAQAGHPEEACS